jgi:hypothetical protein
LLNFVALIALGNPVSAKTLRLFERMRHWEYIVGGRRLQLIDEIDDTGQFGHYIANVLLIQTEPCEQSNVLNLFFRKRQFNNRNSINVRGRPLGGQQ